MGGTIAGIYAGVRAARVRHLVLIDGLGPPSVDCKSAVDQLSVHLNHLIEPRPIMVMQSVCAAAERLRRLNSFLDEGEAIRLAERVTQICDGGVKWTWDPRHRSRAAVAFDIQRHMEILSRISAPTGLVFGVNDWYVSIEDLPDRIASLNNVRWRVGLDSGHSPHMQCPTLLAETLQTHLPRP